MRISPAKLAAAAESTGFRPDMIEKAAHLLRLLDALHSHPFIKGKLALKGGTALNLFFFDMPRLSVDIDLNYVGTQDRSSMLEELPRLERAMQAVFSREEFTVRRMPQEHAGGKWSLRFPGASGGTGNLDVDVNFMFRIPLWPVTEMNSRRLGEWRAQDQPVVDIHEIAAGKLAALLSRRQVRDLFDCHRILHMSNLDSHKLRIAFVAYGAMNRKDWRAVSIDDVRFEPEEFSRQLIPTLRIDEREKRESISEYGSRLVAECRRLLAAVLPFTDAERHFLDMLLDTGEIVPDLLTEDPSLQDRIRRHPLLAWKAVNVRGRRGRA